MTFALYQNLLMDLIEKKIKERRTFLVSKSNYPNCKEIEGILLKYNLKDYNYEVLNLEDRQDCGIIETLLWHKLLYANRHVINYNPLNVFECL